MRDKNENIEQYHDRVFKESLASPEFKENLRKLKALIEEKKEQKEGKEEKIQYNLL